jgi:hypothetical protein
MSVPASQGVLNRNKPAPRHIHDDVAWLENFNENLFHIGQEALAIDRPVNDTWGIDPVMAQGRQEGQRSPTALRNFGQEIASTRRPTT